MSLGIFSVNDTIYFRVNVVNSQGSATDASSGPTFTVYEKGSSTALTNGTMSKIGSKTGYYEGSFEATSFNTNQHFILVEATVGSITPNAQISFQITEDGQSIQETFDKIDDMNDAIPIIGSGTVSVDHNYGKTDKYRVVAGGTPISDVHIRAFSSSDYNNSRKGNQYVVGQSRTGTDGRWLSVIRLNPGSYVLEFSKPGLFQTKTSSLTVT